MIPDLFSDLIVVEWRFFLEQGFVFRLLWRVAEPLAELLGLLVEHRLQLDLESTLLFEGPHVV